MSKEKKEAIFYYLEVLNETEQLMIFTTKEEKIGIDLILNTALPIEIQNIQINKKITKLLEAKE
jgi:hypothetical protein